MNFEAFLCNKFPKISIMAALRLFPLSFPSAVSDGKVYARHILGVCEPGMHETPPAPFELPITRFYEGSTPSSSQRDGARDVLQG